jgi:uncharacterized membrane protein
MSSVTNIIEEKKVRFVEPIADPLTAPLTAPLTDSLLRSDGTSARLAVHTRSFRGPMPPPEQLAQYDRIVPGAARSIVDEFQTNARHSRDIERLTLRGSIGKDTRAQFLAGSLVLIGFGLVYALAKDNHDGVAIAVAVTLLVSVLTAFLTGKVMRGKNDVEAKETFQRNDESRAQAAIAAVSAESAASVPVGR